MEDLSWVAYSSVHGLLILPQGPHLWVADLNHLTFANLVTPSHWSTRVALSIMSFPLCASLHCSPLCCGCTTHSGVRWKASFSDTTDSHHWRCVCKRVCMPLCMCLYIVYVHAWNLMALFHLSVRVFTLKPFSNQFVWISLLKSVLVNWFWGTTHVDIVRLEPV